MKRWTGTLEQITVKAGRAKVVLVGQANEALEAFTQHTEERVTLVEQNEQLVLKLIDRNTGREVDSDGG